MKIIGYLDPGSGSLILQAVLGGVVGVAVFFKTVGRRLFKRSEEQPVTEDESAHSGDESA